MEKVSLSYQIRGWVLSSFLHVRSSAVSFPLYIAFLFLYTWSLFSRSDRDINDWTFGAEEVRKKHFILPFVSLSSIVFGNLLTSFENNQLYAHLDKLVNASMSQFLYFLRQWKWNTWSLTSLPAVNSKALLKLQSSKRADPTLLWPFKAQKPSEIFSGGRNWIGIIKSLDCLWLFLSHSNFFLFEAEKAAYVSERQMEIWIYTSDWFAE